MAGNCIQGGVWPAGAASRSSADKDIAGLQPSIQVHCFSSARFAGTLGFHLLVGIMIEERILVRTKETFSFYGGAYAQNNPD